MFRASLAHPQEALREHSFGGCSVLLIVVDIGITPMPTTSLTIPREKSISITAR
jgi:hypothetical protein